MKTTKNVKILLLVLTTILFVGTGNANAQGGTDNTVIINIDEYRVEKDKSSMITVEPKGKTSYAPLESGFEATLTNSNVVKKELEKWKKEGFKITHFSTAAAGDLLFRSIYILEK